MRYQNVKLKIANALELRLNYLILTINITITNKTFECTQPKRTFRQINDLELSLSLKLGYKAKASA